MASVDKILKNSIFQLNNKLYKVLFISEVDDNGKKVFFTTVQNIFSNQIEKLTLHNLEKIFNSDFIEKKSQFLYKDNQGYHFFDNKNLENLLLLENQIDNPKNLSEGCFVNIIFHKKTNVPVFCLTYNLDVAQVINKNGKSAILDNGLKLSIPSDVLIGDFIVFNPNKNEYIGKL